MSVKSIASGENTKYHKTPEFSIPINVKSIIQNKKKVKIKILAETVIFFLIIKKIKFTVVVENKENSAIMQDADPFPI